MNSREEWRTKNNSEQQRTKEKKRNKRRCSEVNVTSNIYNGFFVSFSFS